jgi:methylornithine synthase
MALKNDLSEQDIACRCGDLEAVLEKQKRGNSLDDADVASLLATPPGKPMEKLFASARAARETRFGDQIFCYGFMYFSTYCKNHCRFCLYRRSNPTAPRYRKTIESVIHIAQALEVAGVHLIDLTMGEDTHYLQQNGEKLLDLVSRCREAVPLPLMISPGVLSQQILMEIALLGVDWYACYQETFNRNLFSQLRQDQDFNRRLMAKIQARQLGLLIEEGLMLGVGENLNDIMLAVKNMRNMQANQVRAMTFRPQPNTPMAKWHVSDIQEELRAIAVFRLIFPEQLIPASLDIDGLEGLQYRLDAGANVVTSLIPPSYCLAGVSRAKIGIEEGRRTVSAAEPLIRQKGLRIARQSEYRDWLQKEKWRIGRQDLVDSKSMQLG